jgi:hypothetical protein
VSKAIFHKARKAAVGAILGLLMMWCCAGGALWQGARSLHYRWVRLEAERKVKDTIVMHPDAEVVWIKKDELRYDGRMFDVKKRIQKEGVVLLVGHYDEKDDKLFASLEKLFGGSAHTRRKTGLHIPIFLPEAVLNDAVSLRRNDALVKKLAPGLKPTLFLPSVSLPVAEAPPDAVRRFSISCC